jgi:hypothetical protein
VYHSSPCCRTEKITKNLEDGNKERERKGEGVYERHQVGGRGKTIISLSI